MKEITNAKSRHQARSADSGIQSQSGQAVPQRAPPKPDHGKAAAPADRKRRQAGIAKHRKSGGAIKLPLWAKNDNGNWANFPYYLLQTFPDGKVGVSLNDAQDHWAQLHQFASLFVIDNKVYNLILKDDINQDEGAT